MSASTVGQAGLELERGEGRWEIRFRSRTDVRLFLDPSASASASVRPSVRHVPRDGGIVFLLSDANFSGEITFLFRNQLNIDY